MRFHNANKIITIGIMACLVVVIAAGATESGGDKNRSSQKDKKAGGGGGTKVDSNRRSNNNSSDNPKADNTSFTTNAKRRTLGTNRHILAVPETFPKDGAYVWCDPDGLWTVYWRSKSKVVANAKVLAAGQIVVESAIKATTNIFEEQPNELQIEIDPNSRIGIIQFTSESDYIDIDIVVNGSNDPNIVFIGSLLTHPSRFPLKLITRRTLSLREMAGVKSTRNQDTAGTFGRAGDSILRSNKTAMPATPSYGGSGGGGPGGRKAKK